MHWEALQIQQVAKDTGIPVVKYRGPNLARHCLDDLSWYLLGDLPTLEELEKK